MATGSLILWEVGEGWRIDQGCGNRVNFIVNSQWNSNGHPDHTANGRRMAEVAGRMDGRGCKSANRAAELSSDCGTTDEFCLRLGNWRCRRLRPNAHVLGIVAALKNKTSRRYFTKDKTTGRIGFYAF